MPDTVAVESTRDERMTALRVHLRAAEAHRLAAARLKTAERTPAGSRFRIGAAKARVAADRASIDACATWPDATAGQYSTQAMHSIELQAYHHDTAASAHLHAARRAGLGTRW